MDDCIRARQCGGAAAAAGQDFGIPLLHMGVENKSLNTASLFVASLSPFSIQAAPLLLLLVSGVVISGRHPAGNVSLNLHKLSNEWLAC